MIGLDLTVEPAPDCAVGDCRVMQDDEYRQSPTKRIDPRISRTGGRKREGSFARRIALNGRSQLSCRSDDAVAAVMLGTIKRLVGALENIRDVLALGLERCDAD